MKQPKAQRVALVEEGSVFIQDAEGKLTPVIVADSNLPGSPGQDNKLKNYTTKAEFEAALAQLATKAEVGQKADASEVAQKANAADMEAALLQKMDKASMVNYATKTDLSGKVDVSALQSQLDLKADKTQIDGFATRAELASKADSATVNAAIATKADAEQTAAELAKKADRSDLANFYTKGQVDQKVERNLADVQGLIAGKADKSDLDSKAEKSALGAYYTKPETDVLLDKKLDKTAFSTAMSQKADITDLDGLASTAYVDQKVGQKADKSDLNNFYTKDQVDAQTVNYATKTELQAGLAGKLNNNALSGYATEQFVEARLNSIDFVDATELSTAVAPLATKVYVDSKLLTKLEKKDLDGLASTAYVDQKVADAVAVDISGLATKSYVDNKTENLATTQYVNEQTRDKASKADLDTKADKDSLKAYYTKESVDDKLAGKLDTATFQYEIIKKADKTELSGLATKTEVAQGLGLKADKTSLQGLATEEYVDQKIDGLVTDSELQAGLEGKLNNNALDPYYNKDEVDTLLSVLATQAQIAELEEKKLNSNVLVTTLQNGYYDKREIDRKLANIQIGSGGGDPGTGGGSAYMTSDLTVTNEVGNAKGKIDTGTALEDVLIAMLTKTSYPTLTAPSASINYGGTTIAKVGTTIGATSIRVVFNQGSISPAYGTNGKRAGAATGYSVKMEGSTSVHTDSNSTGNFQIPSFTRATKGNVVITGTVNYATGPQPKDSEGNNYQSPLAGGSVKATQTIQFMVPFVYGTNENTGITVFTGATEKLEGKGQKTWKYENMNNRIPYIAYDADFGNLTDIKDQNGFSMFNGWSNKLLTIGGQQYKIYYANLPINGTAQFTFYF